VGFGDGGHAAGPGAECEGGLSAQVSDLAAAAPAEDPWAPGGAGGGTDASLRGTTARGRGRFRRC
jgi:hypothetical protein